MFSCFVFKLKGWNLCFVFITDLTKTKKSSWNKKYCKPVRVLQDLIKYLILIDLKILTVYNLAVYLGTFYRAIFTLRLVKTMWQISSAVLSVDWQPSLSKNIETAKRIVYHRMSLRAGVHENISAKSPFWKDWWLEMSKPHRWEHKSCEIVVDWNSRWLFLHNAWQENIKIVFFLEKTYQIKY